MIDKDKIGGEERIALEKQLLREFLMVQIRTYVKSVASNPAIEEMSKPSLEAGMALGETVASMYEVEGDDLAKAGDTSYLVEELLGIDHIEMENASGKIVRVGGSKCPWRQGQMEGCKVLHDVFINGVVSKMGYQCRFTQMITKGDPICCWVLEKKS